MISVEILVLLVIAAVVFPLLLGPEIWSWWKSNRHEHDWYVAYSEWHKDIYTNKEHKYEITRCQDCSKYRLNIVAERKAVA